MGLSIQLYTWLKCVITLQMWQLTCDISDPQRFQTQDFQRVWSHKHPLQLHSSGSQKKSMEPVSKVQAQWPLCQPCSYRRAMFAWQLVFLSSFSNTEVDPYWTPVRKRQIKFIERKRFPGVKGPKMQILLCILLFRFLQHTEASLRKMLSLGELMYIHLSGQFFFQLTLHSHLQQPPAWLFLTSWVVMELTHPAGQVYSSAVPSFAAEENRTPSLASVISIYRQKSCNCFPFPFPPFFSLPHSS